MIDRFLSYVEIKTKITSVFAFLMALAYLFYREQSIHWLATLVFFASMFIFDLTTTTINNYIDTKDNHQTLQFERSHARIILIALLVISTALGIYLVILTDIVVLIVGVICFSAGILYTFGPIPISRLPLGEILSGLFYGFFIPFLMLYINMPKGTFLQLHFNAEVMAVFLTLNLLPIGTVILLSVAPVCTTANIMLANNICDIQKDITVKRFTLPYYIGDLALPLFAGLYYLTYFVTILMVFLGILSPLILLSLLTLPVVQKYIKQFYQKQEKETTFLVSIKNYVIIMATQTVLIFISGLLPL